MKKKSKSRVKRKVFYSYLLNNERALEKSLDCGGGFVATLWKTLSATIKARKRNCQHGLNKPGKIVKITLEIVDD